MDPATALLRFFKSLADESRLKIIGLLAATEHNVQDLAKLLKLKEPTVSHHLAILRDAGLVQMRTDGNTHWYRLDFEALRAVKRTLDPEGILNPGVLIAAFDGQPPGRLPQRRPGRQLLALPQPYLFPRHESQRYRNMLTSAIFLIHADFC